MGFTTPCFIRKNKAELRKKLEELGYKNRNLYFYDCIDCGVNEELFLAIASLRDDTNYMQWFVCTSDYKEYDGKEWKVGDFDLNTCPDDFDNILPHWRKATVNELIEHFK